jgi:hypothetical protein
MQMALRFETPLIIWGESLAEYASWYSYDEMEEVDEKRFNRCMNLGMTAEDMYEFLGGRVDKRDLHLFTYPPRKALRQMRCKSICLGNYIKWDTRKQVEIIKRELGWKPSLVEGVPPDYNYDKVECQFVGIRDYAKYIKRGYGRTAHLTSIDVRNNRLSREEAWELTKKYDGRRPASLDRFLDFLQITEDEFYEILTKHCVHPWKFEQKGIEQGAPLDDMEQWDATLVDEPVGPAKDKFGKTGTYL